MKIRLTRKFADQIKAVIKNQIGPQLPQNSAALRPGASPGKTTIYYQP